MSDHHVERLAELIAAASRILVFTGAGMSTASGIPDYRGPQGVWNTRRPVFYQDFMTSQEARNTYWRQKWTDAREFGAANPNAAHAAIVELERAGKLEMVVTQNVDGLHAAAGTSAEKLVEIHGTARLVECQSCLQRSDPGPHFAAFHETGEAPQCSCGGYLKSATISFGQSLRSVDLGRAHTAAENADLAMSLGSSLVVYPAADIPLHAAATGAPYVIVNQGETDHDRNPLVTLRLDGDVTTIIPEATSLALAG
ncbi:MAG TPA: Sir2 family NAD-dependent protein deacetylase [Acidimicrobiia bacterium]|jgi:NAD-dependent deacetylase|nr:Sir2 family NAD-dependent protein deacetylase [Acidimicrobiia bacterium]